MPSVPAGEIGLIIRIGLMLFLGLLLGEIAARVRIPRVTGYLLAGLLISPSAARLVDDVELRSFDLIAQLALGLIMFNIGGEFRAEHVRRFGKKLLSLTALQMALTWIVVSGAIWFVSRDFVLALVVGFIAMETAPATTLVVIKEYESEGAFTSNLLALVGINNFLCLVLFPFLLAGLIHSDAGLLSALLEIARSILLGLGAGIGLSYFEERIHLPKQQLLLGMAAIALVVGLAYAWGGSGPLATLVMGMAKINTSARGPAFFKHLDAGAYPFYVLFFVIAGANLHLDVLFAVGLLGIAYIVGRTIAKVLGSALGVRAVGMPSHWKRHVGPAMLSHAGVAIGLSMAVGQSDLPSARVAQAVVLGSVVFFELVGPLAIRYSLVQCGEVRLVSLMPRLPGASFADIIESVAGQVRSALGLPPQALKKGAPLTARHIMRRHIETIPDNARLDEVLKLFSVARYDVLPVVDAEGAYIGNISFPRIQDVIFDQVVADLLIARDLLDSTTAYALSDEALESVLQKFGGLHEQTGSLPVLADENTPRVVGMVRRRDALDIYWRQRHGKLSGTQE